MRTIPRPEDGRKKVKNQKRPRSPLGEWIAGLVTGRMCVRTVAVSLFGLERANRLLYAATHVRWHSLGRAHLPGEKRSDPAHAEFQAEPQCDEQAQSVRLFLAHVLKAYERTSIENRRACSSALFRGHTHRLESVVDGPRKWKRVYVPAHKAGGALGATLKRGPRTFDRHIQVLEAAGLANVWQPEFASVPDDMRGAKFAYAVWEWRDAVPVEIARALVDFYAHRGRSARARQSRTERPPETASAAERGVPVPDAVDRLLRERLEALAALEPPPS